MRQTILKYLCCPMCRSNFTLRSKIELDDDIIEGCLTCENRHRFKISHGVADFNSKEQDFINQWESISEDEDFADFDSDMDRCNPTEILVRREMVLSRIASTVSARKNTVVLDIASGRGMMLGKLAENLAPDVDIISVDLSAFVLKYDRKKFRQIAPNCKISFLACDATNLPLKDSVIDAATTYGGFSNMLGCADQALKEAHRVLSSGGILLDSFVIIEKESQGFQTLQEVCTQQNLDGAEDFFLHDSVEQRHNSLFASVECHTVFEGIGVSNGMDLLPYDGEWYAEQVFQSQKL